MHILHARARYAEQLTKKSQMDNPNDAYFGVMLNGQQRYAFEKFRAWVNGDKDCFLLRGHAGTGKTTLVHGFIRYLQEKKIRPVLMAPTARAAKVMGNKAGVEATTIHRKIYDFSRVDADLEKLAKEQEREQEMSKTSAPLIFTLVSEIDRCTTNGGQCIYLVDEASMIGNNKKGHTSFAQFGSGQLLSDLFSYAPEGRFIFIGDPIQLPPVRESHSPALDEEYLMRYFQKTAFKIELTKIIRHKGDSGVLKASMLLRKKYHRPPAEKWPKFPIKGFGDIILHYSEADLVNAYLSKFEAGKPKDAILICHTNAHAYELNKLIRRTLGRRDNHMIEGDLLLVTQNVFHIPLINSDVVEILDIGPKEWRAGLTFTRIRVRKVDAPEEEYTTLIIDDVLYSKENNVSQRDHRNMMIDFAVRMKEEHGIKQNSPEFKEMMKQDAYLNALKASYGYVLTVHKAQGGEWDDVFLTFNNKIYVMGSPNIYRWMYTAVTRAKQRLHIMDDWYYQSGIPKFPH